MSSTSSSDTRSLMPTRPRSCASDSGSGVESRSRAHSARLNSMNLDITLQLEHQRQRHRKPNRDDEPPDGGASKPPGEAGAENAAHDGAGRHDQGVGPDHEVHPDEVR